MGKEFKNIDDLFRSELGGTVTEAPSFVKGNIDNELGFRKKRIRLLSLALIALLTVGGTTAFFLTDSETNNNIALNTDSEFSKTPISKEEQPIVTSPEEVNTNPSITENNAEPNHSNNNTSSSSATEFESTSINIPSEPINRNPENTNLFQTNNISTSNTGRTINDDNGTVETEENTETVTSDIDTDGGTNLATNEISNETNEGNETNEVNEGNLSSSQGNETTEENGNTTQPIASLNEENNDDSSIDNPTTNEIPSESDEDLVENNEDIDISDNDTTMVDMTLPEAEERDTTTTNTNTSDLADEYATVIDPLLESNYKPWMISLTSGINATKTAYTSNDMNEKILYDNSTQDRLGIQTNLDVTYRFKNGLTFGTGIGMVNYTENYDFAVLEMELDSMQHTTLIYDYDITYGTYYTVDVDTFTIVDSTTFVLDSGKHVVDTSYSYTYSGSEVEKRYNGKNKASYFTLPVHLGTQILWKDFQLDLFASARLNFLMRSSGGYYSDNTFSYFEKANSIYKPFYLDVMFASKIHYNFWKNLYLTGTVQYRPVMGSAYKPLSFNKSFDYVHFGLGLSIKL